MSAPPPLEVLEGGREPSRWRARWTALPRRTRAAVVVLGVLLLVGAGSVWLLDRAAERDQRQRVVLSASLGFFASSTTRPGGEVVYFALVRNGGATTVSVTSVDGEGDRLRLRMRDHEQWSIRPGGEVAIPLSVRLTCAGPGRAPAEEPDDPLSAAITARRQDGASVTRRVGLSPAGTLLGPASTLCDVRPDLRDHELSGPVLHPAEGP